jgi:hypothetical protein
MGGIRRSFVVLGLAWWALGGANPLAAQVDAASSPSSTQMYPRPIPMGSSCGNLQSSPYLYTGTCGLRVRYFAAPQFLGILSNNHVLGAQGPTLCPNTATPLQTTTLQPGTLDIGSIPANPWPYAVGVVAGFVPIDFSLQAFNFVDAAVSFTGPGLASTTIVNLGEPTQAVTAPAPGMAVVKTGRTTDTTAGTIQSVLTTAIVSYGADCGTARFLGQIVITPGTFSGAGDSGSAILEEATNIPVGLLFAGSAVATVANDIRLVYLSLGIFPDVEPAGASVTFASPNALRQTIVASRNEELERVGRIRARVEAAFFRHPDVVGLGVGRNEDKTGLALVTYVRGAEDPVARALPASVEGVPVRVVHSGVFSAYEW